MQPQQDQEKQQICCDSGRSKSLKFEGDKISASIPSIAQMRKLSGTFDRKKPFG